MAALQATLVTITSSEVHLIPVFNFLSLEIRQKNSFFHFIEYTPSVISVSYCYPSSSILLSRYPAAGLPALSSQSHRLLIRRPTPTPPAIPISASFHSPGPFTTQPITATLMSRGISCTIVSTLFFARPDQISIFLGKPAGWTGYYFHTAFAKSKGF